MACSKQERLTASGQNKAESLMVEKKRRVPRRKAAAADQTSLILQMMGDASFVVLSKLFDQHPAVSDMHTSPAPEVLNAFQARLMESPYVKGLFRFGRLREALDALEAGYQAFRRLHCVPVTDAALVEQKRKEREVRFIMRLAAVLGPAFSAITVPANVEQNERQEALVDALKDARGKLALLLQDEFFREDLAEDWRVAVLRRMLDDMTKAGSWLAPESYRPVKKRDKENVETSTASTRQIANRLSDACFRIYANCDEHILKLLLTFDWLGEIKPPEMRKLIQESLERKIDQFNRKSPNEDYVGTDLFGQWCVSRDIDPPWMAA